MVTMGPRPPELTGGTQCQSSQTRMLLGLKVTQSLKSAQGCFRTVKEEMLVENKGEK